MKMLVSTMALALLLPVSSLAAQQTPTPTARAGAAVEREVEQSGIIPALEALTSVVTPELERTFDELAHSLSALVTRIAADPELRTSAARATRGVADVAEAVVVEQSNILQDALRAMADHIEASAGKREGRADPRENR